MQERLEESQESVQDLAPAEQPVEETEPVAEVDPETRVAELEAQVAKLENDLRSKDGQRRKESDRDAELSGLGDELGAVRKMLAELAAGMSSGNLEDVATKTLQMNQELDKAQASRSADTRYDRELNRLVQTVSYKKVDEQTGEEEDMMLISQEDSKKLTEQWQKAWDKVDSGGSYDDVMNTHLEATAMALKEERRKSAEMEKTHREELKSAGKKALENAGIADLDTGAAIAGGNESLTGTALIERGLRKQLNTRL